MIRQKDLATLIEQRLLDSEALLVKHRYSTAYYIVGYALEIHLKLHICKIFKFNKGFPVTRAEFDFYQNQVKNNSDNLFSTIPRIREIKNHDLHKLLFYSGLEYTIKLNFLSEWDLVSSWSPEMRYNPENISKNEAFQKISAVKKLIQNIYS